MRKKHFFAYVLGISSITAVGLYLIKINKPLIFLSTGLITSGSVIMIFKKKNKNLKKLSNFDEIYNSQSKSCDDREFIGNKQKGLKNLNDNKSDEGRNELELVPENGKISKEGDIFFKKANSKEVEGDLKGALDVYNEAIKLEPKNSNYYFYRGRLKNKLRKNAEAINDLRKAIEINPYNYRAKYVSIIREEEVKKDNKKSHHQDEILEVLLGDLLKTEKDIIPYDEYEYNLRGISKFNQGEIDGCIYDLDKAIEIDKQSAILYFNRGLANHSKGDFILNKVNLTSENVLQNFLRKLGSDAYDLAIKDFTNSIRLNPNYGLIYARRAYAKVHFRDTKEGGLYAFNFDNCRGAYGDLKKASELGMSDFSLKFFCRQKNFVQDLVDENITNEDFDELKSNSESIKLKSQEYFDLANIKVSQFDTKNAIFDYDKSIELDPNNGTTYRYRGLAKKELNNIQGALIDWVAARELGDKDASNLLKTHSQFIEKKQISLHELIIEFYLQRTLFELKKKNIQSAINSLDKAINIRPKMKSLYSLRGIIRFSLLNYSEAISDFTKAIELNSNDLINFFFRGLCIRYSTIKKEELLKAISDFSLVIKDKEISEAYIHIAHCEFETGNYKTAINHFKKAIQINPNLKDDQYISKKIIEFEG